MKIQLNPDKEVADAVKKAVKENNGYCPCVIQKTPDTKCMCKEFRENETMEECHCGLFVRV